MGLYPTVFSCPYSKKRHACPPKVAVQNTPVSPLLQQGAPLHHFSWTNPALPTLLRSTESPLGKEPVVNQTQEEGTKPPAEILMEYLCPLTPLSVSVADNTCHVFSKLCRDQAPQYSLSGKRCQKYSTQKPSTFTHCPALPCKHCLHSTLLQTACEQHVQPLQLIQYNSRNNSGQISLNLTVLLMSLPLLARAYQYLVSILNLLQLSLPHN